MFLTVILSNESIYSTGSKAHHTIPSQHLTAHLETLAAMRQHSGLSGGVVVSAAAWLETGHPAFLCSPHVSGVSIQVHRTPPTNDSKLTVGVTM